jgi:hypothetical protein
LIKTAWLCLAISGPWVATTHADPAPPTPLPERVASLSAALTPQHLITSPEQRSSRLTDVAIEIQNCAGYPYEDPKPLETAHQTMLEDLRTGLETGLSCLIGQGPMGRLHPYHEYQAHRLLKLFENQQAKTLRCVADQMFATAVATSPKHRDHGDPLARQLSLVEHPGVLIDTYRLGGLLSRTHDDQTFRSFFHLSEEQIYEHRNGQPIRARRLHRFEDRPALLFHEVIHWLGHEHGSIQPDVTHLYETCCFGGSDYIADPALNAKYQATACNILRDDELWSHSYSPYKQMRIWRFKEYDQLKKDMRADYTR